MSYGGSNTTSPGMGTGSAGLTLNPEREMGYAASKMRRKAIANALRGENAKHGLIHAPTISHPRNGRGGVPQQFSAGSYKGGGY